ncbi:hypothetical protein OPT61_g9602 [Boeremia exigua]|uniref:Uncharacterized protein n=1 Tax=Boeremia exigua TaxID=749465 RepID=A0ACC2HTF0_9PLEO|nr:hypothetical protein OPT61_g9602 [Boeremia exigua]
MRSRQDVIGIWQDFTEPVPWPLDYTNTQDVKAFLGEGSGLVETDNIKLTTNVDALRADAEDLLLLET